MNEGKRSRIPGFHQLSVVDRQRVVGEIAGLSSEELADLRSELPLSLERAAGLAENTIAVHALPFGIALNFCVNGRDCLIPMVTEEPSVIAAASNAARLAREG